MRQGDWVGLRDPAEILATLDAQGTLDGVPFMPEMLRYFGRAYRVDAQVNRACDTIGYTGVRYLRDTVLLDDLRCDGSAHAGCDAQCRIYWKEAWLCPADPSENERPAEVVQAGAFAELQQLVLRNVGSASENGERVFRCQATELIRGSEPVGWWSPRSFLHEVTGGNMSVLEFVRVMSRVVLEEVGRRLHVVKRTTLPFPREQMTGGSASPTAPRGLQPGQLVQIKQGGEISRTLNATGKNRGLWFDREMKVYCGANATVKARVNRFIDEKTGKLIELGSDCYILDSVVCKSHRSDGRWLCPRAIYPWWREAWLDPVGEEADAVRSTERSAAPAPGADDVRRAEAAS
jgi:hypothetical protein